MIEEDFKLQDQPDAVEKYFCEDFEKLPRHPMDDFLSKTLIALAYGGESREMTIPEAEKPFLYKLIEKRIRYCFTFSILDERLLLFLTAVAQTPGKAIMYLTYMQYWAKRHKQFVITFDDFCMKIFPHGFPNDEDLHDVWVKQKIKNGNLLDFQSAMVSIQFDDVKFKENT